MADTPVVIWHNPRCGTSRKVLELIRQAGIEPEIVEYLKILPDREALVALIARMGIAPRELLRSKETAHAELGLDDPALDDEALVVAMVTHPILINRPIVQTARGAALCRPPEKVLELLDPSPRSGAA